MEENGKYHIHIANGVANATIRVLEGPAPRGLDEKEPVKMNCRGSISAPYEFLSKRLKHISINDAILFVNRDEISITLVINETDSYRRGVLIGALQYYPKFNEFGINLGKGWEPSKLGLFMKMNRSFFPDKDCNRKLVSELMNFNATVNQSINKSVSQKGDVTDNFSQVVNSNLPQVFTLKIPIFKGTQSELIEVETFAQIDGREVIFILLSPGANQAMEEMRDHVIDEQLDKIRQIAPDLVIIEQ